MLRVARLLVLCVAGSGIPAQSQTGETFDDLARRAESLLDSQPAEAAGLYKQALAIGPSWAEGWLYMGAALYSSRRYAEATDAFRKGIELDPGKGTAWAFLGLSEAELGDPDQALADMRKGEDLGLGNNYPFEVAVRVKAAQTLAWSSAFDEAMAQLHAMVKHPDNPPAVPETMGLCAMAISDDPANLSPERRAVVDLAGKAAWETASRHPDEARANYKLLLERYPNEPGVHYAHGLYQMETDLAGALAEFEQEVKISPQHWPSLIVIGSLRIRQGMPEEAIQSLREAMKYVPVKYRWLCHAEIGRANMATDRLDTAIAELQTATRQMPDQANIHFFLAEAYRRAGKKPEAEKERAEFEKLKVQQDPLGVPSLRPFAFAGKN